MDTWIPLVTGLVAFGTALVGFLTVLKRIKEVHVIVNSRMTTVLARVDQLTEALEGSNTDVPEDPGA